MSTKIYNGYRLSFKSREAALSFPLKVRHRLYPIYRDIYTRLVLTVAAGIHDMPKDASLALSLLPGYEPGTNKDPFEGRSPIGSAVMALNHSASPYETPTSYYYLGCSFVMLPPDEVTGHILCLFYDADQPLGRPSRYLDAWEKMREVVSYPYWNNSDKPDRITWPAWRQRGKEWARACPETGLYLDAGLRWQLLNGYCHPEAARIMSACARNPAAPQDKAYAEERMPSLTERARLIATNELQVSMPHPLRSRGTAPYSEYQRQLKAWREAVAKRTEAVAPKLKPLTLSALWGECRG